MSASIRKVQQDGDVWLLMEYDIEPVVTQDPITFVQWVRMEPRNARVIDWVRIDDLLEAPEVPEDAVVRFGHWVRANLLPSTLPFADQEPPSE